MLKRSLSTGLILISVEGNVVIDEVTLQVKGTTVSRMSMAKDEGQATDEGQAKDEGHEILDS